jgi:hypothetical protein
MFEELAAVGKQYFEGSAKWRSGGRDTNVAGSTLDKDKV